MEELAKAFPQGLSYSVPFDTTIFVKASITEVYKTLIEAAVLVLIVILVFLQDWRAMLVPATTVPVTIIGAFAAMAALGFTVNLSTLFAIILAIGIVVDDAIVIVEGAAHHMERGLTPHDAAIKAMDELFGPIIGITLVLMSVFIPVGVPAWPDRADVRAVRAGDRRDRDHQRDQRRDAEADAVRAVAARADAAGEAQHLLSRLQPRLRQVEGGYAWLIGRMTRHAGLAVIAALIVGGLGVWGVARLPTAFIPIEDQGYVMIGVQLPDGAAIGPHPGGAGEGHQASRCATPGVDQVVAISGISVLDNSATLPNAGVAYVILKDWSERSKAAGTDLLSLYLRLVGCAGQDARGDRPGAGAAADPGHRQRQRLHHAGGAARRQLRLHQAADAQPDHRQ